MKRRIPPETGDAEADLKKVRSLWENGKWLTGPLQRRTSSDRPSPRTLVARAPMAEETSKRASPAQAWIQVDVGIAHEQFFSAALLAGTMSVLIMLIVLGFFLYSLVSHGGGHAPHIANTPSPEVLAAALTLFTAVQAGRIEPADQSTLRGLLSALGWLVIAASLMPTIVLAVAIAFNESGWAPVQIAIAAIAAEILLQLDFQLLLRRRRVGQIMGIPRRLELQTIPLDYSGYSVLQSEWWRNTTADALKIGRPAYAYVVWEKNNPSLLELIGEARQSEQPLRSDNIPAGTSAPEAGPANILALLRAGTSDQALTFLIFREEPATEWIERWQPQRVELDPDRLAPMEIATDIVELFVSVPRHREPPAFECHPLGIVLAVAASCRLSVLDVQLPVPSPLAAYQGSTWARVRVGLHDGDIHLLARFLIGVRQRINDNSSLHLICHVLVRTAPEQLLRTILKMPPEPTSDENPWVTASEIDVITASSDWQHNREAAGEKNWRVLALTANARIGIDHDILAKFGPRPGQEDMRSTAAQHLRLAGVTYSVMHGIAVILALGYQPRTDNGSDAWEEHFRELEPLLPSAILVDEWQSAEKLGTPGGDPLLSVRINAQDRPGTLIDVLKAVNAALRDALPSLSDDKIIIWHALTRVTVGHETRLIARLKVSLQDVNDWDAGKFEEIERASRRYAAIAAADRGSNGLLGGELGAPEDTVIDLTLIEASTDYE